MNDLISFKENLKDSITSSLLDYLNYMHETKKNPEVLEKGNDALAKCVIMCGELFANKVKKGELTQEDIESFESNLVSEDMLLYSNNNLNLANAMVKEGDAMALTEFETRFNDNKGLQKVA